MYLSARIPGLYMREKVEGKSDFQKTDSSIRKGTGRKQQIQKCETQSVRESGRKVVQGEMLFSNQESRCRIWQQEITEELHT